MIDEIMQVNEAQADDIGCQLAQNEGILSGLSTGAAVYAALQIGYRPESRDRFQGVSAEDTVSVDIKY